MRTDFEIVGRMYSIFKDCLKNSNINQCFIFFLKETQSNGKSYARVNDCRPQVINSRIKNVYNNKIYLYIYGYLQRNTVKPKIALFWITRNNKKIKI